MENDEFYSHTRVNVCEKAKKNVIKEEPNI